MDKEIIISIKTIAVAFAAILGVYVIYRLGPIFAILLVSALLVLSLEHLVKGFMKQTFLNRHLSRSISVIITYAIFVTGVVVIVTLMVPPIFEQAQKLFASLFSFLSVLNVVPSKDLSFQNLLPGLSSMTGGVVGALSSGLSIVTSVTSLIMLSLYMSLDWENLKRRFISLFPDKNKLQILRTVEEVELNVGNWVKGELLLMLFIGIMNFVMFVALGVKFPLALGLIAGLLEIVPILGPVIAGVLGAFIAFADSPVKGLAVIIGAILIQQLENNILVPKIMQKVSGFSPLVILVALLVGNTFFGLVGGILAIPFTIIAAIIAKSVFRAGNQ